MKKKFKIMYPADYHDAEKRGKPYLPNGKSFVVMSGGGIFFLMTDEPYMAGICKLSEVLGKYDVVWKD